jgi:predicted amidohydrolase
MSEASFQLAMGQMLVQPGELEENVRRARRMIAEAAEGKCRIVVLPECLDVGWTHPSAREFARPIPGPTFDRLAAEAARHGIHVVAGLTERDNLRIYNTAVLIGPDGRLLLKHRKVNLLDIAQDLYSVGDRLGVADTELGRIGIDICADNFPSSLCLGHSLGRMGARILLSPCAWAVPADYDNAAQPYGHDLWYPAYRELAQLYEMPVIGVSNVGPLTAGPWAGRQCIGSSLAMGADGTILAEGPFGVDAESLLIVSVNL